MAEQKAAAFDETDALCVRSIGVLAADMVERAKSGHPGAPMGMAAIAHVLWTRIMTGNGANSQWAGRDRFVLSNGHACALQYVMLHLGGYELSMDDLKAFRQLDSRTPGHPENVVTDGVELSTGPLGQGIAQAVGLAIASKYAQSMFGPALFSNTVFVLCGDGCLQEGVSAEASSLAGHLALDNLVLVWDDNAIQIDGGTELAFSENVAKRYEAYGWRVLFVDDANRDLAALEEALLAAKAEAARPTLICAKTKIGFNSTKEGTHKVHGSPLGAEALAAYKETMGFDPAASFVVDAAVYERYAATFKQRGRRAEEQWAAARKQWAQSNPLKAPLLDRLLRGQLPEDWEAALPVFDEHSAPAASRNLNGAVLNAVARALPELIGGAADLTPSTKTQLQCSHDFQAAARDGRYLRFGVREFAMFCIGNGISAFGAGLVPFTATFLTFVGYGYGALRVGALSHLRHIYVLTHDSVLLGEDGPTHQPVEALAICRAMPNVLTMRPCDGNEVVQCWRTALRRDGPTVIALSRQKIATNLVSKYTKGTAAEGAANGCYVLNGDEQKEDAPDVTVICSGSEVELALEAAAALAPEVTVRVVSALCLELFDAADLEYRRSVLPPGTLVISLEASSPYGWARYAHKNVGVPQWGKSAPLKDIRTDFGFTAESFTQTVRDTLEQCKGKEMPLLPTLWPY